LLNNLINARFACHESALLKCGALFFYKQPQEAREIKMMNETHSKAKIVRGIEGLGTITPQMIEERAREIARSDGRSQPNDLDRSSAREELTGAGSEKIPTREEPGRDWEMPLVSTGEKAPTVRPEDDQNIPEELILEGVEEADHDQRVSSKRSSEK
jgi:hypothetical protein